MARFITWWKSRARELSTATREWQQPRENKLPKEKKTITFLFVYNTILWFSVVTTFGAKFSSIYYYIYAQIQCACLITYVTQWFGGMYSIFGRPAKERDTQRKGECVFRLLWQNVCLAASSNECRKWKSCLLLQGMLCHCASRGKIYLTEKGHPTFFSWTRN